ncbi:Transcriptional regulator atrx, partial [Globisporangium polare]
MASLTTRRSRRDRIDDEDGDDDDRGTAAARGAGHDVTSADDESEVEWNDDDGEGDDDGDDDEEDDDDDDEGSDDSMDSTADMEVSNANANDDDFESADGDVNMTSRRRTRSSRSSVPSGSIATFFTSGGRQAASGNADGEKKKRVRKGKGGTKRKDRSERAERIRNRRRKIADVREDDDLDESTRKARDAERERASHIIDFEQLEDVVEIDAALAASSGGVPTKEPLLCLNVQADGTTPTGEAGTETAPVFVHEAITGKLKKHQVIGARFLWSHIAVEPNGFGCVLADFMGLGKTLQVITVVQAFFAKKRLNKEDMLVPRHKHVLILAPTICVRNWEAEVVKWLGKKEARRMGLTTLESSREKKMTDRIHVVKQWHKRGGLLIMGYELYRILVLQSSGEEKIAAGNQKYTQQIKEVYKCLANPGPDLIVLDEGHRVRDHKSKLVKALGFVKTARRIILTGYPLQNHLEEYWTMVNFARPDYLGTLEEFKNRFVDPIKNAQCIDSSEADLRLARQRAFVLTRELKPLVLRRDQQYLFKQLPPKKEWVLLCKLSEPQAQLYRAFLEQGVPERGENSEGFGGKVDVLGGYHISLAISNHPDVLCESYNQLEEEMRRNPDKFNKKNARFQMHGEDIDGDLGFFDLPMMPRS